MATARLSGHLSSSQVSPCRTISFLLQHENTREDMKYSSVCGQWRFKRRANKYFRGVAEDLGPLQHTDTFKQLFSLSTGTHTHTHTHTYTHTHTNTHTFTHTHTHTHT